MTFQFRPAVREGVGLFIAIAGSSRSGKTLSALKLAKGIAGPTGRIAALDTEGKRMSHYKDFVQFDVAEMTSPFAPDRFTQAARDAQAAGYAVLVIDSFSLEWSGVGGVLATQEAVLHDRFNGAAKMSDTAWKIAKAPHKHMLNDLIQLTMPIIFCLRANEVAPHLAGNNAGRWKVEQDKRFLYEWTVALTLHPDTPGKPRYDLMDAGGKPLWKVQDQHRSLFPEGQFISEDAGAALQAWRNSDMAASLGSSAVEAPRAAAKSPQEWFKAFRAELADCETADEVAEIAGRYDVREALANTTVERFATSTNDALKTAMERVQKEAVGFAPAAV